MTVQRLVDERHPIAGWLYRAEGLPPNGTVVLDFRGDHTAARKMCVSLMGWRSKGRLGPPGSFPETARDPRGEGRGFFDRVTVSQHGDKVHLQHVPEGHASLRAKAPQPPSFFVVDPPGCSHVNTGGDFDVVTG